MSQPENILVADDDPSTRLILARVLTAAGYTVHTVADGDAAIASVATQDADLLLLDVEMPGADGLSVCRYVRKRPLDQQVPVIIMTSHDDTESVAQAFEAGATDFLHKPIAWSVLPHRIRFVLRAHAVQNQMRTLIRALPDQVFIIDRDGDIVSDGQRAIGRAARRLRLRGGDDALGQSIGQALASGELAIVEAETRDQRFLDIRLIPQSRERLLVIARDISNRKQAELKIRALAYRDNLTGLANRNRFETVLAAALTRAAGDAARVALLYIDLDRFKRINDTLGHEAGDRLLCTVADALRGAVSSALESGLPASAYEIARIGGDEFVVLLEDVGGESDAAAVAQRILDALRRANAGGNGAIGSTSSIGIAMYPDDGETPDALVSNADSAMYSAKSSGRNTYCFFSRTLKISSLRRMQLEDDLSRLVLDRDLELELQPQTRISDWALTGAEVLVRWRHPAGQDVSTAEFVNVAEEIGIIDRVGRWVFEQACELLRDWRNDPALADLRLAVNVSSAQLDRPDLVDELIRAVTGRGLSTSAIELESTESILASDSEQTMTTLNALSEAGFSIALDDFGSGFSSLSYLSRFPIDKLKLDRSFVAGLDGEARGEQPCSAIFALARELDLRTIAEGVERRRQLAVLEQLNCDAIQGYLVSRPVDPVAFVRFARRWSGDRSAVVSAVHPALFDAAG